MAHAVILTWHDYDSPAQVDMHFLAQSLLRRGWRVSWVTVRWGPRAAGGLAGGVPRARRRGAPEAMTIWRANRRRMRLVAALWLRLTRRYQGGIPPVLARAVRDADLVVFDSGEPVIHAGDFVALSPSARLVYRVSDVLESLSGLANDVVAAERRALPLFHAVYVSSEEQLKAYASVPNVVLLPHGIDVAAYDAELTNPYVAGPKNAVFSGMHFLDLDALAAAAAAHPAVGFHLLGPWAHAGRLAPNITVHGVVPFHETVPYVRFADVALHLVPPGRPGATSLSRTLKVQQYSYCGLPIVTPAFLPLQRDDVFTYDPADPASVGQAVGKALAFDRAAGPRHAIWSWDAFTDALLEGAGLSP